MGTNPNGEHDVPDVVDWIHQFIIPPKDSMMFYIEFLLNEDNIDDIIDLPKLFFHIQLKINKNTKYKTYQKFEKTINDELLDGLAHQYNVYEPDQA